jgi:hypothetical protein
MRPEPWMASSSELLACNEGTRTPPRKPRDLPNRCENARAVREIARPSTVMNARDHRGLHTRASGTEMAEIPAMVWFFAKGEERLQYEIRRALDGEDIEVVITRPNGIDQQRIRSASDLLRQSQAQWAELLASGWRPVQLH